VFVTSIVLPFSAVMMSPGRYERPPGMFSQDGTTASTLTGSPSSAIAPIAARTAPPPPMSVFISSMRLAGFREIPPESKVIALPTSPRTTSLRVAEGGS